MTSAATTEFPAAARFSARINSGEGTAGLVDMQALSLEAWKATSDPELRAFPEETLRTAAEFAEKSFRQNVFSAPNHTK
jgi:hypothetical protein